MAEAGAEILGISRKAFLSVRCTPGIIHYTTGSKPWMYRKDVHYTHLYNYYLALKPWNGCVPPDRTPRRRFSKAVRFIRFRRWLRWQRA